MIPNGLGGESVMAGATAGAGAAAGWVVEEVVARRLENTLFCGAIKSIAREEKDQCECS